MFKKLMTWLGRYRIINDRQTGEPYLERYYLFLKDRNKFPFNIFEIFPKFWPSSKKAKFFSLLLT